MTSSLSTATKTASTIVLGPVFFASMLLTGCGSDPESSASGPTADQEVTTGLGPAVPVQSIAGGRISDNSAANSALRTKELNFDADQVWRRMVQKFSKAQSYSDQSEWNLQYRINGQLFVETQPIQLNFSRLSNRWYAQSFRTQVINDGRWTSIRINEVPTNNLDQQVKVAASDQWTDLFADPIAQVYLGGATDFPLKATTKGWPALFFPQLSWLNPDLPNQYFANKKWQAAGQGTHKNRDCLIIRQGTGLSSYEIWIDRETDLPVRMFVPNDVLDWQLSQAPDISDLRLSLDFGSLSFEPTDQLPEFRPQPDQKLVSQFVKVPEAFPCSYIGKPSPAINWTVAGQQQKWSLSNLAGRNVVAIFLPNDQDLQHWAQVTQEIQREKQLSSTEFLLVPVQSSSVSTQVATAFGTNKIVLDGWQTFNELGLANQPTLVVWDGHGIIQYATEVQIPELKDKATQCLSQLKQGHSVAADMIADYRQFYDRYQNQLSKVTRNDLPLSYRFQSSEKPHDEAARLAMQVRQLPDGEFADSPLDVELNETNAVSESRASADEPWRFITNQNRTVSVQWQTKLKLPQDIFALSLTSGSDTELNQQPMVGVLDGYRTIEFLKPNGQLAKKVALQLPTEQGVSQIRHLANSESFIAFQPGDQQLFIFDASGQLLESHRTDSAILDVQLIQSAIDSPASTDSTTVLLATIENDIQAYKLDNFEKPVQTWPIQSVRELLVHQLDQADENTDQIAIAVLEQGQLVRLLPNGAAQSIAAPYSKQSPAVLTAISNSPSRFLLSSAASSKAGWWSDQNPQKLEPISLSSQLLKAAQVGQVSIVELKDHFLLYSDRMLHFAPKNSPATDQSSVTTVQMQSAIAKVTRWQPASGRLQVIVATTDGSIVAFGTTSRVSQSETEELR